MKTRNIILMMCSLAYIMTYVYAAVSKLLLFQVFVLQINQQPFDDKYTPLLVILIPMVEIMLTLMLIIPTFKRLGLYLSTGLMLCFTIYIVLIELNYFGGVPCSCAGVIPSFTWPQHLIFNLVLLAIGGIGIYIYESRDRAIPGHK
jgi:putative oxidoreductase